MDYILRPPDFDYKIFTKKIMVNLHANGLKSFLDIEIL